MKIKKSAYTGLLLHNMTYDWLTLNYVYIIDEEKEAEDEKVGKIRTLKFKRTHKHKHTYKHKHINTP